MLKYVLIVAGLLFAAPGLCFASPAPVVSPPAYCTATGGAVQSRYPAYNTNGGPLLVLAYHHDFCDYLSKDGSTHIDVLLGTLVTTKPTLAALAYYAKQHVDLSKCQGGPGSCYCSDVGGTDEFGGINAAGGGWVLMTNVNDVLDVCVFPDLSAIDAYGLFYHAYGIIRGQNLEHLLRFPDPY